MKKQKLNLANCLILVVIWSLLSTNHDQLARYDQVEYDDSATPLLPVVQVLDPVLIDRPDRPGLPDRLRVAFLDLRPAELSAASASGLVEISEIFRLACGKMDRFDWVQRGDLDRAVAELGLTQFGSQPLAIGAWAHAQLVVMGTVVSGLSGFR